LSNPIVVTAKKQKLQKTGMPEIETNSQERILKLLQQLDGEISAQELYVELRHHNQALALATVYRALKGLKLKGMIQSRSLVSGESVYKVTEVGQHYLTCLRCGQSIPIADCPACETNAQLPQSQPFKIYYHILEFFGLCPSCQH
jgi:Fur family ferric uptake transcriptional regulator